MAGVPYVGAPEIKARWTVLAVRYHSEIGNPGLTSSPTPTSAWPSRRVRNSGLIMPPAGRITASEGQAVCNGADRETEIPKPAGWCVNPLARRRRSWPFRPRFDDVPQDDEDERGRHGCRWTHRARRAHRRRGLSGHTHVGHADTWVCLFRSTNTYDDERSVSGRLTSPAGGGRGPNHWRLLHRAGFAGLREVHAAEEGLEARGGAERVEPATTPPTVARALSAIPALLQPTCATHAKCITVVVSRQSLPAGA